MKKWLILVEKFSLYEQVANILLFFCANTMQTFAYDLIIDRPKVQKHVMIVWSPFRNSRLHDFHKNDWQPARQTVAYKSRSSSRFPIFFYLSSCSCYCSSYTSFDAFWQINTSQRFIVRTEKTLYFHSIWYNVLISCFYQTKTQACWSVAIKKKSDVIWGLSSVGQTSECFVYVTVLSVCCFFVCVCWLWCKTCLELGRRWFFFGV